MPGLLEEEEEKVELGRKKKVLQAAITKWLGIARKIESKEEKSALVCSIRNIQVWIDLKQARGACFLMLKTGDYKGPGSAWCGRTTNAAAGLGWAGWAHPGMACCSYHREKMAAETEKGLNRQAKSPKIQSAEARGQESNCGTPDGHGRFEMGHRQNRSPQRHGSNPGVTLRRSRPVSGRWECNRDLRTRSYRVLIAGRKTMLTSN